MRILIDIFTKNILLKIVAVLMAIIFWFIVQAEQVTEVQRKLTINLATPEDVIIQGGDNRQMDIRLKGPKAILAAYYVEGINLQATLTLPHKQTGKTIRIRMQKQYISNLHERIAVEFDEAFIEVLLHQKIIRNLPVRPVLIGKPKDGYTVEKIIVEPAEIELEGGANDLASLLEVNNVPLNITDLSQSTQFEDVLLDLTHLKTVKAKTQIVTIKLLIGEEKRNKKFENIPVLLVNDLYRSQYQPKKITIEIQGTKGIINFIKPEDFQAVIDVKDDQPGSKVNKKVQVKIPPNTTLIESTPEWITVRISNYKK